MMEEITATFPFAEFTLLEANIKSLGSIETDNLGRQSLQYIDIGALVTGFPLQRFGVIVKSKIFLKDCFSTKLSSV